ncbi:hypothetical protein OAK75_01115 [Bacteriovoracales bacterium]|nr:hypothetical protein [Bacteriovoracales bacterium]
MKRFLTFFFLLLLFSSCNEKKSGPKSWENFKTSLPSPWQIKIEPIKHPPYEWNGPLAEGFRLEIFNPQTEKELKDKSYKKLYPKSKKTHVMRPQLIRYFYEKIEAGYSFGMMQRRHPAKLVGVTDKYVIFAPPFVSPEKDVNVPSKIKDYYKSFFDIKSNLEKHAAILKKGPSPFEMAEARKNKEKFKGKKAIIFKEDKHGTESLGVMTLN